MAAAEDPQRSDMDFIRMKNDYTHFLEPESADGRYYNHVKLMLREKKTRLTINLNELRRYNPALWRQFLDNPMKHIPPFEAAFNDYVKNGDHSELRKYSIEDETFRLGFDGAFGSRRVDPKTLHSSNITNLMCVEGIVTKVSLVRPKVVQTVHYAKDEVENKQWHKQSYRDATSFTGFRTGSAYPTQSEDGKLYSTEFGLCTYEDNQIVFIQDMPERTVAGTMPRSVECILDQDLVDACKPGDRVQMIGVYRCLHSAGSGDQSGLFKTVLIVNHVKVVINDEGCQVTGDDVRVIKKMSKQKHLFDLVSRSIAPSIYGHEFIKKALVLLLVGGVEKNLKNGTHIRGDINILMVGDPSVAKSQILRSVMNTAPLAINTTGRGASGVGLTAAVTQDRLSGERRLEAGAMVLADRGIVCIDEFDKMSDADRVAIHEVMEQQTVTIAKAGIHTSLNARCSVIAASNPVYGQYDKSRPPHENIALPDSLLSRFDLLFVVLDKLDTELDRAISDHVLNLHQSRRTEAENEMYADMEDSDDDENHDANDVWEKTEKLSGVAAAMRNKRGDSGAFLKKDFCKKYIAYCKSKIKPVLTEDAVEMIAEKYAQLRDTEQNATLPITARCLETMIRLSSAHAKLRLSRKIEKKDVTEVLKVLQYALNSSNTDDLDDDDEDEEMGEEEKMELDGDEEEGDDDDDDDEAPRRKKRIPSNRNKPVANRSKKRRAEAVGLSQKDIVTRNLARYFRSKKVQEVDLDDLHDFMTENNKEIEKEDLKKIILQLDTEDKIFFVPNENMIHQV